MLHRGNWHRIKECMKKARAGKTITTGFFGGSITQGSCASRPELCYAYLVYEWWQKKFPQSKIAYLNAGIGGTTSQFGVSRVEEHLLKYRPDFVLIEFAVNDDNTEFFKETYEGLIRKTYGDSSAPAVLLMNNVRYDNGNNAQEMHLKVAQAYELPMVSMKDTLWPMVKKGQISSCDITTDHLHPNDAGHAMVAEVIIRFLEQVYRNMDMDEPEADFLGKVLPDPITANAYENSVRYQNYNSAPELIGFKADLSLREKDDDVFKCGWTACHEGDKISFEITCTGVAVQYRKAVAEHVPAARVIVDGKEEKGIVLDGSFKGGWGDYLCIDTVAKHMEMKKHRVEIDIIKAHENDDMPFYLVSVIGSG